MPKIVFNPTTNQYETIYDISEKEDSGSKLNEIISYQDQIFIRKLYGGLPIYNTSSGINSKVGEIYLIKSGSSNKRLCVRFEGITVSTSLT